MPETTEWGKLLGCCLSSMKRTDDKREHTEDHPELRSFSESDISEAMQHIERSRYAIPTAAVRGESQYFLPHLWRILPEGERALRDGTYQEQ